MSKCPKCNTDMLTISGLAYGNTIKDPYKQDEICEPKSEISEYQMYANWQVCEKCQHIELCDVELL